ncbi:hypothetical protein F4802DRAFT_555862 [Xylaria palmicola]|nr:hypothetical protein F4802DRAFT_555862 [Xylaria palmicola]
MPTHAFTLLLMVESQGCGRLMSVDAAFVVNLFHSALRLRAASVACLVLARLLYGATLCGYCSHRMGSRGLCMSLWTNVLVVLLSFPSRVSSCYVSGGGWLLFTYESKQALPPRIVSFFSVQAAYCCYYNCLNDR